MKTIIAAMIAKSGCHECGCANEVRHGALNTGL
jgi:hypothetical protein